MREIKPNTIYRHFKGRLYYVHFIAKHSETGEKYVVYNAMYGNYANYIRPYEMFASEIDKKRIDNITNQKYRFEEVGKGDNDNDR